MRRRYFVLRAFSLILRILGWIGVIVGLILFVVGLVELLRSSSDVGNMLIARDVLGGGIGLVITGLILVLYGELIEVFFDIEANTRRTAEAIARLAAPPQHPPS
ncbi:MAG TPA: hypothetical protein VMF62_10325 [Acetobacteraceae bacterium]|jgi:vacuolar-type H+-ATPase subunit I/STV1|nr:hypothetical protein [Acetobacteraceae bacterium]